MSTTIARMSVHLSADNSGLVKTFAQTRAEAGRMAEFFNRSRFGGARGAGGTSDMFAGITASATSITAIIKGLQVAKGLLSTGFRWGSSFVQMAIDMERAKVSLEVMLGSASRAEAMFRDIRRIGLTSTIPNDALLQSAQTMLGFGVSAGDINTRLKQLGDISGGNVQRFEMLTLAFAQASAAGRLMGQDLLQFVNAGFNPLLIVSEKTGISMAELRKHMEEGSISIQHLGAAFDAATEKGGKFHGMQERMANTFSGQLAKSRELFTMWATGVGDDIQKELFPTLFALNLAAENIETIGAAAARISQTNLLNPFSLAEAAASWQTIANFGGLPGEKTKSLSEILGLSNLKADWDKIKQEIEGTTADKEAENRMKRLKSEGEELAKSVRKPGEIFIDEVTRLNELLDNFAIGPETFARALIQAEDTLRKSLEHTNGIKRNLQQTPLVAPLSGQAAFTAINRARQNQFDSVVNSEESQRAAADRARSNKLLADILKAIKDGRDPKVVLKEAGL